ncbi:L-lactate permease, partial [Mycobacterium tuberculosis]|nr:L-lactate permease [Mycobacterium tuberculosis]
PESPDNTAAIASSVSFTLLFKVWQPTPIFRSENQVDGKNPMGDNTSVSAPLPTTHYSPAQIIKAWMPFVILTAIVSLW